jgi:hypothetical protein
MANAAIIIPFYVAKDGQPLTGAAAQMEFEHLRTTAGADKLASAPSISEIGGGWYSFSAAYGTAPFDAGDLAGVIDADKNGSNKLADAERYIPVEVRLDFYALARLVNRMSQDKLSSDMSIKDSAGDTILCLAITENATTLERDPGVAS